ncbi:hypothetical protein M1116_01230 [Patescibacteria group bacterium]|nr:hypothetical protein [Patescibacteria group bacterium]
MTPLQQAIKQTQEYASRFGGRLSKEELCQRLLSPRTYSPEEILLTAKRLGMTFYSEHSEWQTRKLDKAKRLADKLKSWPEILLIGVTGSVAAGYPDEEEDIDLFK